MPAGSKYVWLYAGPNVPEQHQSRLLGLIERPLKTARAWGTSGRRRTRDGGTVGYVGTTTGLYVLFTPALGEPILNAMTVAEWSLPHLNAGAP